MRKLCPRWVGILFRKFEELLDTQALFLKLSPYCLTYCLTIHLLCGPPFSKYIKPAFKNHLNCVESSLDGEPP